MGVEDQYGQPSTLFQELLNSAHIKSFDEALDIYKNTYSEKLGVRTKEEEKTGAEPQEVVKQTSKANVKLVKPKFLKASDLAKALTSAKMLELKEKHDELVKRWGELEEINSCLWS